MNLKQLTTFEVACSVEGLEAKKVLPDFSSYPKKDRKAMIAHAKLVIIARAANRIANGGKEWKPDFSNHSQWKYTAYFFHPEGGSSGFRFDDCGGWNSSSSVGSRLCFISREVAEHVGKTFIKLYNEYFL
jgi:hypothetical protein